MSRTKWGALIALASGFAASGFAASGATAHPGGLNAEGCHNDRKNGGYHCHRAPTQTYRSSTPRQASTDRQSFAGGMAGAFRNCTEARAAGAAPIRRGEPGYGPHLDRDGDGIACEPYRGR